MKTKSKDEEFKENKSIAFNYMYIVKNGAS